jgi:hypothetical protein
MRVVAGLSFPSCGAATSRGESSAGLAMEASRQRMGGVGQIRWAFGRRRRLVERLGGRSASVTSSFPPPRGVGGRFWLRKRLDSAVLVGGGGWWSVWGWPRRPDGLGCYPLPTPPHSRQRWWRDGRTWWRCDGWRQRCGGQRRVRGSLGGRVASTAPPSPLPSLLHPHGFPAAHGGLVARSASGGSERAHAVALAVVRWPSSWMAEAMELGCDRCVRVRWRRRNMCLTSEVEHGWRWWCAGGGLRGSVASAASPLLAPLRRL